MMGHLKSIGVLVKTAKAGNNYVKNSTIVAIGSFRNSSTIQPISPEDVLRAVRAA